MQELFCEIIGGKVRYARLGGHGPLIVILHGWPAKLESWLEVGELLAQQGFDVLIPDFPGFGHSEPPPAAWDVAEYASWVKEFLWFQASSYKLQDVSCIVGHSFGGRVTIKLAAQAAPKLATKIVLGDAAGIRHKPAGRWAGLARAGKLLGFGELARRIFYRLVLRRTDYLYSKGVMRQVFKKVVAEDLTWQLAQIKAPTLLLWGRLDKYTPLTDGQLMHKQIENSRLVVFDNVGHSPQRQIPERVAREIARFITDNTQPTMNS